MAGINLLSQLRGKKKARKESTGISQVSSVSNIRQTATNYLMGDGGDDRRLLVRFLTMIVFFFGCYKGLEYYQQGEIDAQQGDLNKVQDDLAKENKKKNDLKSVQEEMLGYQTKMADIQQKIKLVSNREGMRDYFVRTLDYIATEMPRDVWFTEITANRGATGVAQENSLTLRGYANSPQAVSELILKLDNSVYFPRSNLERLDSASPGEMNVIGRGANIPVNARRFYIMSKLGE